MKAVGPLQFVAITGTPADIDSICGRPHPSPEEGITSTINIEEIMLSSKYRVYFRNRKIPFTEAYSRCILLCGSSDKILIRGF
jgi:hypothetical protein